MHCVLMADAKNAGVRKAEGGHPHNAQLAGHVHAEAAWSRGVGGRWVGPMGSQSPAATVRAAGVGHRGDHLGTQVRAEGHD